MIENQKKKEKNVEKKKFLPESPSARSFRHSIRSLRRRANARGSVDIICRI